MKNIDIVKGTLLELEYYDESDKIEMKYFDLKSYLDFDGSPTPCNLVSRYLIPSKVIQFSLRLSPIYIRHSLV